MLHAARRSFRHDTQVGQGTASRPRPLAAPVRSHPTRFQIRAFLMCLALAQSTAVTTTTASEVVVVGAVVSASIFNGLKHLALPAAVHSTRWWCRRRCGGRVGASVAPHTHPCRRASPRAAVRPFWAARGLPRPVCVILIISRDGVCWVCFCSFCARCGIESMCMCFPERVRTRWYACRVRALLDKNLT